MALKTEKNFKKRKFCHVLRANCHLKMSKCRNRVSRPDRKGSGVAGIGKIVVNCGRLKLDRKMTRDELMRAAIELSVQNVANGGGPFGAVIARDGEIIATGVNRVTAEHDPTAHAEVSAIRAAARKLGTFDLSGCEIYTSCEPCPMCLGAIYWARLDRMFYGNDKNDAASAGFDDAFIYRELELEPGKRRLPSERLLPDEAARAFDDWMKKEDRIEY